MAEARLSTKLLSVSRRMAFLSDTSSGIPPRTVVIMGNPIACASSSVVGKGSSHIDGITAISDI